MKADHLQNQPAKVSGHLEEKRGIYQMVLNWTDINGNRQRKSVSTGLKIKGNKKRAEDMLREARKEHQSIVERLPLVVTK